MIMPLIWLAAGGLGVLALRETDDVINAGASLTKWLVIGGAVYVAAKHFKVL
jgi:NADP-dependent 3-hydroxy acid dehydrogenase YdfG